MESFDFDRDVLALSSETPVVVDFWAPWCGPCRFLGPIIEQLAGETEAWKLVKLNTDEHQELMHKYQIRGIPAVKMFFKGEVVAEFTGALPKHQIERWLEDHLPDPRMEALVHLEKQLEGEDEQEAVEQLTRFVGEHPGFAPASLALAQFLVWSDPQEAAQQVEGIKIGNKLFDSAQDIRNVASLNSCDINDSSPAANLILEARSSFENGDLDQVIQKLVEAVTLDKEACDDLPRKSTISIFNLLGPGHDLTRKYRRSFDMALY